MENSTIAINFTSAKYIDDEQTMYSKSDNIEVRLMIIQMK